jgi:hypothetical protein
MPVDFFPGRACTPARVSTRHGPSNSLSFLGRAQTPTDGREKEHPWPATRHRARARETGSETSGAGKPKTGDQDTGDQGPADPTKNQRGEPADDMARDGYDRANKRQGRRSEDQGQRTKKAQRTKKRQHTTRRTAMQGRQRYLPCETLIRGLMTVRASMSA